MPSVHCLSNPSLRGSLPTRIDVQWLVWGCTAYAPRAMPPSLPARIRPAALIFAFALAACGDDADPAPACPNAADPCACDPTLSGCSSDGSTSSASSATTSDDTGGITSASTASDGDTASSGAGEEGAVFSVLPPFDVVGTEWVYENEYLDIGDVSEHVCRVDEAFTWPDEQPGVTRRCITDGRFPLPDERYALYPDRIQRRESGTHAYEPPADLYRVPLQVGDAWDVAWSLTGSGEVTESWTVLAEERVELGFGSFDAAKLELRVTTSAGQSVSTAWWVDGIGVVRSESDNVRSELLAFTQP